MRSNSKKLLFALSAAALMVGCTTVKETTPAGPVHEMTIETGAPETRTALSGDKDKGFSASWTKGDVIAVFETASGKTGKVDSKPLDADAAGAQFSAALPASSSTNLIYSAVYPASAVKQEGKVWTISIPEVQNCAGGSFDKAADLMVAGPAAAKSQPDKLPLEFRRLGAVLRIEVTGLEAGETISEAKISTDGALISGSYSFNPETGEAEIQSKGSSIIKVIPADNVIVARVMPVTTEGFSVQIATTRGKLAKSAMNTVTFAENTVQLFKFDVATASTPMEGEGTEKEPFIIKTVEDLCSVGSRLVLETPTYFEMGNDIDLTGVDWTPINPTANNMRMVLDGKNHTISNLTCSNKTYASFAGLLAGEIKNLKFDHCTVTNNGPAGTVAGWVGISNASFTGSLENVHVTNSVVKSGETCTAQAILGGLAGRAGGATITNCSVKDVTVTSWSTNTNSWFGGLIGEINTKTNVSHCSVEATVEAKGARYVGGIFGGVIALTEATDLTFKGKVISAYDDAGGLVGVTRGGTFKNVTVEADITAGCTVNWTGSNYYSYCGGMVGTNLTNDNNTLTLDGCSFKGTINAEGKCVGGMVGQANTKTVVKNCTVEGEINARQFTGGMIGYVQNGGTCDFENCENKAAITISEGYLGGMAGMTNNGVVLTVKNCKNTGNLTGKASYVAGMIGRVQMGGATLTGCMVECDITSTSGLGGLVGDAYANTSSCAMVFERCSYKGTITGTTNVAGMLGKVTQTSPNVATLNMSNCFSTGAIMCTGSYVAGICGDLPANATVRNCYSSCAIKGTFGIGGIVSRACNIQNLGTNFTVANGIVVEGCLAWNPSIKSVLADGGIDPAKNYSAGAVVGYSATLNTLKNSYRRQDMVVEAYANTAYNTLVDHEDCSPAVPLVKLEGSETYMLPYNGKATASTPCAAAKTAGWDESIWDLTGDEPKLK